MTRTVGDAALIMNAIAGHDSRDPSSSRAPTEDYTAGLDDGVDGLRTGIVDDLFFDRIDPEVERAVGLAGQVLEELGASVDKVPLPMLRHSGPISTTITLSEAAAVHMEHLRSRPDDIDPTVRPRLEVGAMVSATDYIKAQRARALFNQKVDEAMERFDILLTPTEPITAPKISETEVSVGGKVEPTANTLLRNTRPFNLCGLPTISLPCGFSSSGLPIGLQLTGRAFAEGTVLRAARTYERATDWHTRRPPI